MTLEGFSWLIAGKLAGLAYPEAGQDDLLELRQMGVRALVSLTERALPGALVQKFDIAYLHLPIANFAPPKPEQIDRFVSFCEDNISAGRPVAVHCLAGMGRTGTMLACYLVWQGTPAEEAIETVRDNRPHSIETVEQERAIVEYAARVRAIRRAKGKKSGN
jgi:atypical dual specificity phosphatase